MTGLTSAEATRRLAAIGANALPAPPGDPLWRRVLRELASPLTLLLCLALAFDLAHWLSVERSPWPLEAIAIAVILAGNAGLGLYQRQRSESAIARLNAMTVAEAWVRRAGSLVRVPAEQLVPGDWVRLEAGNRVPADGRLVRASGVQFDESTLTGESLPVEKADGDEAFSGTLVVGGRAWIEVTKTGAASAMGRLAATLIRLRATVTPLERRINQLGRQIAVWIVVLVVVLGVAGVAVEGPGRATEIVLFAVALAVAATPEGLPAVLTIALALGVERMARRRALVRRLAAVEALGSVTVIATDKTGTLTEGRMDVRSIDACDAPRLLQAIVSVNDADLLTGAGHPLDLGLLRYAVSRGVDVDHAREPGRVSERTFDSASKFSRVTVREGAHDVSYVKGAPEVVLNRCDLPADDLDSWREKSEAYAREGFRVLAVAWAEGHVERGLTLLGLVLFWDPPRSEVPAAIRAAQRAGIRVLMVTGDHPATALAIAHQVGIEGERVLTGEDLAEYDDGALADALRDVNVFARVHPDQKLRLVEALQRQHHIVAMTGDGINDAAALKRADVGVAMGQRGTDVSREVADLVLLDDNFATIVHAIDGGRRIYENIQKFLRFLFSTNLSEVLVVAGGLLMAAWLDLRDDAGALWLPLTAAQILWINLLTDGLPALALVFDRSQGTMDRPPLPANARLLDPPSLRFVVGAGTLKAALALVLLAVVPRMGYDLHESRAATFHFMAIGQLFLTFAARKAHAQPLPNWRLLSAVVAGAAIQVAAASLPLGSALLGQVRLPRELWILVVVATLAAWFAADVVARIVWRRPGPR